MTHPSRNARKKHTSHASAASSAQGSLPSDAAGGESAVLIQRHLRFGWFTLFLFLLLGLFLESLHGLKVGWYLEVSHTTRRHMWTLAHAHGTLLALINLIFALTLRMVPDWAPRHKGIASASLLSAALLLPAGFFFGGLFTHDGDPGVSIVLVPIGGVLLLVAIFVAATSRSKIGM